MWGGGYVCGVCVCGGGGRVCVGVYVCVWGGVCVGCVCVWGCMCGGMCHVHYIII